MSKIFLLGVSFVFAHAVWAEMDPVKPFKKAAAIVGTLSASKECKEKAQVWVSIERTLLYQAETPPRGSFEFHTLPGIFNIVATSPEGCFAETKVELKADEVKKIDLNLVGHKQ